MNELKPADLRESNFNSEIDLVELFNILWNRKLLIITFVLLAVITFFIYQQVKPKIYLTSTDLIPISSLEEDKYYALSKSGLIEIDKTILFNLYIEQIVHGQHIKLAINKFDLISIEDYDSEEDYYKAVASLAASLKVNEIFDADQLIKKATITIQHNSVQRWKRALEFIDIAANKSVQGVLKTRFNKIISFEKDKIKNSIEDIDRLLINSIYDYNLKTADRLAYLKEQAKIARLLNISVTDPGTFNVANQILSDSTVSAPFYYRGYIPIEAEIDLIESRENKDAFIEGLSDLKIQKRKFEQNKEIERAEYAFKYSPINSDDSFIAGSIIHGSTNSETGNILFPLLIVAIISFIIISIHVLLWNAMNIKYKSN